MLSLSLLAAACSSDDDDADTIEPAPTDATSAPGTTPAETTPVESTTGETTAGAASDYKIAVLMPTLAAGYPAAMTAHMTEEAEALGVEIQVFDAGFDPQMQFTQCQDAIAAGDFDGIIALPASSPSMIPCAEEAAAAGIPVIATNTPIGNDFNSTELQAEGVVSQVFVTAQETYDNVADAVLDACADRDPCNVGVLLIVSAIAISQVQDATMAALAESNPTINIVGVAEGGAQRSGGLQATQDFLQAEPDLHVLVSGADDMLLGAEEALDAVGLAPGTDVAFIGQGGSTQAVEYLRRGAWTAISVSNADVEGRLPLQLMIQHLDGEQVESYVNSTEAAGLPQLLTADNIGDYPDFEGTFDS